MNFTKPQEFLREMKISHKRIFILRYYKFLHTHPLNIFKWKRPGKVKASKVQQVAPTRAIKLAKLGMANTTPPLNSTMQILRTFYKNKSTNYICQETIVKIWSKVLLIISVKNGQSRFWHILQWRVYILILTENLSKITESGQHVKGQHILYQSKYSTECTSKCESMF